MNDHSNGRVRIAQISDLHFGREVPSVVEGLLGDLDAVRPDLVAVCGDLTQRAREREFLAARAFLDRIAAPALVVPGNHDLPAWWTVARFTRTWQRWRWHISGSAGGAGIDAGIDAGIGASPGPPTGTDKPAAVRAPDDVVPTVVHATDDLVAVGVNTARRAGWHPDWSRGRINGWQLLDVQQAFAQVPPSALRVVVAHHPFLLSPAARSHGLVGRSRLALQRLREAADLLLGGHVHLGYSGVVDGLVVAQSGTACSDRLRGQPNGYNLIDLAGDRLTVTIRRWAGAGFEVQLRQAYLREDHRWRPA